MIVGRAGSRELARSVDVLALTVFLCLFFVVPDGASTWVLTVNLAVFYLLAVRALVAPDRILPRLPTYLTIEVLFLGFSYLIFYYPYQLFLIGASDLRVSQFVSNSFADSSNKAITLATVGMLAFTLGYRIVKAEPSHERIERPRVLDSISRPSANPLRSELPQASNSMASAASLLLAGLIALYVLAGWRSAGEGRYTGKTTEGLGVEGVSIAILMLCMVVGALWIQALAMGTRVPPTLAFGLAVASAWTVRLLILGDRSSFLLFGLVLVGGYFTFVKRASPLTLGAILAVWLLVYELVEILRFIPDWYRSGDIWELLKNSEYYRESTGESSFNITTITLRATVEAVPAHHDYTYGVLKIIQFSSMVPFSGKLYLPYLDPDYTHSAQMLGDIMLGSGATWNTGTNVISDSYIDFGVPGVVSILFLIGLAGKLVRNITARYPDDSGRVVFYLLSMSLIAELPRYSIDLPIRTLAWALVFIATCNAIALRTARSPTRPNALSRLAAVHLGMPVAVGQPSRPGRGTSQRWALDRSDM